ncbi:MAG: transposase, partial [Candidatus Omnitrophica bacterium]|nr:transposase [Candidatus Omnitrophota bacterium]
MPRVARSILSDIPYHIIHRGNNRQKIFFSDSDHLYFLSLMHEAKKKHPCKIYSYALMPNHVHFLLESFQQVENLAKFVKLVAQKYAQYINKAQRRTGTLWEGRFKSSPVSQDSYLLACTRYIELNSVRANIINDPADYKWSSYRFKTGDRNFCSLLDMDPLYTDLGSDEKERQANYKKWFSQSIPEEEWDLIRKAVNKGGVFGNIQFKEKLE